MISEASPIGVSSLREEEHGVRAGEQAADEDARAELRPRDAHRPAAAEHDAAMIAPAARNRVETREDRRDRLDGDRDRRDRWSPR